MLSKEERLAKLKKLQDPMSEVLRTVTMLKGETGAEGPMGPMGPKPEKGVDYFTDAEVEAIIKYIQSFVKDGEDGYTPVKGKDYFDGKNGANGAAPAKGIDYWTKEDQQKIIDDVLKNIYKPKDGVSPNPEDVAKMVMKELNKDKKTPEDEFVTVKQLTDFLRRGGFRGGNSTTTSTGGFSVLVATGTVDDSNVTFTFTSAPTLVNINGSFYNAGATSGGVVMWTIAGTTVTLANPVGSGGSIFGI